MKTRIKAFSELPKAFAQRALGHALAGLENGDFTALDKLAPRDVEHIPPEKKPLVSQAYYALAKSALAKSHFPAAETRLRLAQQLDPKNGLFAERLALLRAVSKMRAPVQWRLSLNELQTALGCLCVRRVCTCTSHYQIAKCRGLTEEGFRQHRAVRGVAIHTVAPYHPYSNRGRWTRLLKSVKHEPYDATPLRSMADILADFILEETTILEDVDAIVPVPASPSKFAARGFAPTDIVAKRLGGRLALSVHMAIVRKDGVPTQDASDANLVAQFEARAAEGGRLAGLSILLVEDIWTRGRTIPICAAKLQVFRPKNVVAVALGLTQE